MEDDLKKKKEKNNLFSIPLKSRAAEDDLKKIKNGRRTPKKNGRRPNKKIKLKTTSKRKWKTTSKK